MNTDQLRSRIAEAFEICKTQSADLLSETLKTAVFDTVTAIDQGILRTAQPTPEGWQTLAWTKEAILLYFKLRRVEPLEAGPLQWCDKIPLKKWHLSQGVRVVPPAIARFGSYVAKGCVLMPSYINIGAFVDEGTMVDTWATVGSCAQVGKNVHLSGGVGLGGVLEPAQAAPVIVEDECFLGSRAIVVEGVHLKRGAVLGAGVVLTASTPIVDMRGQEPVTTKGVVPENCVVIPGTIPKKFPAGTVQVPCALIIGQRTESTDRKTSLTQALREFEVSV